MKISKLLFVGFIFLLSLGVTAQTKQEVGVYLGGGLSTLDYKQVDPRVNNRMGFVIGGSYRYFITDNWAIQSGLELSKYNSETNIDAIAGNVDAIDDEMASFVYQYTLGGYNEKQNTYFLNIPLMVNYQTSKQTGISNYYVSAGMKFGLPVSSKYKSLTSSLSTSGYYPANNVTYDDLLYRGFGTFADVKTRDNLKLKMQVMLSAECGMKNKIGEKLFLYTGIYFDYGLNDIASKNKDFMNYNSIEPLDIRNNSVLNSHNRSDANAKKMLDKVNVLSLGVKINLAFEL